MLDVMRTGVRKKIENKLDIPAVSGNDAVRDLVKLIGMDLTVAKYKLHGRALEEGVHNLLRR